MNYPWRVGEALDQFLNVVVLDGQVGETISLHAATQAHVGKAWACALCRWLLWTVEADHCPKVMEGENTSLRAGLIAGVQLLLVFAIGTGVFWWSAFD